MHFVNRTFRNEYCKAISLVALIFTHGACAFKTHEKDKNPSEHEVIVSTATFKDSSVASIGNASAVTLVRTGTNHSGEREIKTHSIGAVKIQTVDRVWLFPRDLTSLVIRVNFNETHGVFFEAQASASIDGTVLPVQIKIESADIAENMASLLITLPSLWNDLQPRVGSVVDLEIKTSNDDESRFLAMNFGVIDLGLL